MKTEAQESGQKMYQKYDKEDKVLVGLYIGIALSFLISLVIFAMPVKAENGIAQGIVTGLVKVQPNVDGQSIMQYGIKMGDQAGNVWTVSMTKLAQKQLIGIRGISTFEADQMAQSGMADPLANSEAFADKYKGSSVVVGLISNVANINAEGINSLSKLEGAENVGFMMYKGADPSTAVVMRNLYIGESNMLRSLNYMIEYAKTVERPLVVEMVLDPNKSVNPLFVQACENLASAGVQFINNSDDAAMMGSGNESMCFSLSLIDRKSGAISDQTAFWCEDESVDLSMMLVGTDRGFCNVELATGGNDSFITLKNKSDNLILLSAMDADGDVNYYHIDVDKNDEYSLTSKSLFNNYQVVEMTSSKGAKSLASFHSKGSLLAGAGVMPEDVQSLDLSSSIDAEFGITGDDVTLNMKRASKDGMVEIEISEVATDGLSITVFDKIGNTIYQNTPSTEFESMTARLNLSDQASEIYFLRVESVENTQDYALVMR